MQRVLKNRDTLRAAAEWYCENCGVCESAKPCKRGRLKVVEGNSCIPPIKCWFLFLLSVPLG